MMKVCHFCGNKNFRSRTVQYIYKHDEQFLIVNDVPCEECEFCGEQYFRSSVLKKIEKDFFSIHAGSKKSSFRIEVPVEEFANIA